jgi:hypothetical protein
MTDLRREFAHKRALILAASVLGRTILGLESDRALRSKEEPLRHGKAPVAHHGLPYFAFALGFIFPCAQRRFISRDSFLFPAALMRPRLLWVASALGERPTIRRPVELTASSAEIARSMRSRSARSSASMLLVSKIAPLRHPSSSSRRLAKVTYAGCLCHLDGFWGFSDLRVQLQVRLRADPQPRLETQPPPYLPIEYVPVHSQSYEPSALAFPEQVPEPLMPLCFPVPLTIFHLLEAGFVVSVEAEPSYV